MAFQSDTYLNNEYRRSLWLQVFDDVSHREVQNLKVPLSYGSDFTIKCIWLPATKQYRGGVAQLDRLPCNIPLMSRNIPRFSFFK